MAHDTQEAVGVGFDRSDEMTMGFELEMPALDQVDLFARGHDRGLHGRDRTGTAVSTGIRIRAGSPKGGRGTRCFPSLVSGSKGLQQAQSFA